MTAPTMIPPMAPPSGPASGDRASDPLRLLLDYPPLPLRPQDLTVGDVVTGLVGVETTTERESRRGPWWLLTLRNGSGKVTAKAWSSLAAAMRTTRPGTLLSVEAKVEPAYGSDYGVELTLTNATVVSDADPHTFWLVSQPRYQGDPGALWDDVEGLLASCRPEMQAVFAAMLDVAGAEAFRYCPGAPGFGHHAYLHGLLEHSLEVAEGVDAMCRLRRYAGRVDRDFAVVAALLHDIGKVREYQWTGGPMRRANAARFASHLDMGAEMVVEARLRQEATPTADPIRRAIWDHLAHVCRSHHMEPAHGSTTAPASVEAVIVAVQDAASAHVANVDDARIADVSADAAGFSQAKIPLFKRGIYHTPLPE